MDNTELDILPDETKYYIPTIEEFHVGFNYEIWKKKLVYDKVWKFRVNKYIFNEKQVTQTFFNYNFTEDLKEDKIRVKYLDREDIKSLGFTQITNDCFNLLIKNYRGRSNQELRILIRQTILIYLAMDMNYNDKDNMVLFTGIIKNKSELIKLLKQLGIG